MENARQQEKRVSSLADSPPRREELLTLWLFGAPHFTGNGADKAAKLLDKPKALALLVYLAVALPKGLHRRNTLLALLWPDIEPGRARNSLRQALHLQRIHLPVGSLISRGADEVGIAGDSLAIDVSAFEDHLEHTRDHDAMKLYRGELLNGFVLRGNPEFEIWLSGERERLHRRAVRGALVLARAKELDANTSESAHWARFALERAPYDEDVLREVIEILARVGDRSGALRAYDAATERFQTELGISLSGDSQRIGRRLRGEDSELLPSAVRPREVMVTPIRTTTPATAAAFARPRQVTDEARRLCLEARQLAGQRSPVTIMKAIEIYERAISLSPDYAEAHAGVASALCQAPVYVAYPGVEAWPRVRAHASRAIRLDRGLGDAHVALAHATLCYEYDWTLAERLYRNALELDPIRFVPRQLYALYFLTSLGRADEALAILDRARDDMPDIPGISVMYAMSCVFSRRFERGLQEIDFILKQNPDFVQALWVRGMALEGTGDVGAAIKTFERGVAMTNRSSLLLSQLGRACARNGDRRQATQIIWELDQRGESGGPAAYFSAEILAALGSTEPALDRLYAAYRQRNPFMVFAGVLYGLDPLRDTRRFRDLLMRLGLPAYERTRRAPSEPSVPLRAS